MHLVGLIIRIYHDARSPEGQIGRTVVTYDSGSLGYHPVSLGKQFGACETHYHLSNRPEVFT